MNQNDGLSAAATANVDDALGQPLASVCLKMMPEHTQQLIRELMIASFCRGAIWQLERDTRKVFEAATRLAGGKHN